MEKIYDKFSEKSEDYKDELMEQADMMNSIYQFYSFIEIDCFQMFLRLNNRFEYENGWRFNMTVS